MDKWLKMLLGATMYVLDQADESTKKVRSRAASNIDDLRDLAQDKYETASDRVARASRAIRGEDSQVLGNVLSLAAGIGIGVGIGMLFAPSSGEQTRKAVADKVQMFGDKFKSQFSSEDDFSATGTNG